MWLWDVFHGGKTRGSLGRSVWSHRSSHRPPGALTPPSAGEAKPACRPALTSPTRPRAPVAPASPEVLIRTGAPSPTSQQTFRSADTAWRDPGEMPVFLLPSRQPRVCGSCPRARWCRLQEVAGSSAPRLPGVPGGVPILFLFHVLSAVFQGLDFFQMSPVSYFHILYMSQHLARRS